MTTESDRESARFLFKRFVVAVNSSPGAALAAEVAAALAARYRADLHGLFVEDIDLVHLAALQVGRLIRRSTGKVTPFDESAMRAHFALERSRSRHALENASTRQGVVASFEVSRGRVEVMLASASREADLMVIALAEDPHRRHVGTTALAAAEACGISVLLLRSAATVGTRVLVLLDSLESAPKVLGMALGLASGEDASITIVPIDPTVTREHCESLLRSLDGTPSRRQLASIDEEEISVEALCARAAAVAADVVVMSADTPSLGRETRRELLARLPCPLLLVR